MQRLSQINSRDCSIRFRGFETHYTFLLLALFSLNSISCDLRQEDNTKAPESKYPLELCFQRLEGTRQQDSSFISLRLNGNQVSGVFHHIPYEKDSRKGTISGIRTGNILRLKWFFMQEGLNDTLEVEFKLQGNTLHQKTFGNDSKSGRQQLTDTSTFSLTFLKTSCL